MGVFSQKEGRFSIKKGQKPCQIEPKTLQKGIKISIWGWFTTPFRPFFDPEHPVYKKAYMALGTAQIAVIPGSIALRNKPNQIISLVRKAMLFWVRLMTGTIP